MSSVGLYVYLNTFDPMRVYTTIAIWSYFQIPLKMVRCGQMLWLAIGLTKLHFNSSCKQGLMESVSLKLSKSKPFSLAVYWHPCRVPCQSLWERCLLRRKGGVFSCNICCCLLLHIVCCCTTDLWLKIYPVKTQCLSLKSAQKDACGWICNRRGPRSETSKLKTF